MDCATDLNDSECEKGTITSVKNMVAEHIGLSVVKHGYLEGTISNTTDIFGYVDPGGEAECGTLTADGAASSADVLEGLSL